MTPLLALVFVALVLALGVIWTIVRRLDRELTAITATTTPDTDHPTGFVSRDSLVALANAHHDTAESADLAVIALEIADLTSIRESMGYEAAERTVREVTRRLQANTRDHQDLAWASDARFLLMLKAPMTSTGTLRVASRVTERLMHPLVIDGVNLRVRVHAGAALGSAGDAASVVENAEFALGRSRQMGQTTPVLYDETEREQAEVAFRRAQALRTATDNDELRVVYQPILDLVRGRLTGVEALLRWESPTLGPISPAEFIPIAEDTGTIVEIGGWVLEQACRDIKTIGPDGQQPSVSVNVSVHQLRHRGFVDVVHTALMGSELDPSRLTLEVTESTFANPVEVTTTLDQLRDFGVRVALDDVGTGYSSLAQLATLPIDVMKLDRMLLTGGIGPDDAAARVFTSVAALGRSLGLDVVAEGVETEDQSTFAREAGCTHEQGFLRARPMPLVDAMAFARRAARRSPIR